MKITRVVTVCTNRYPIVYRYTRCYPQQHGLIESKPFANNCMRPDKPLKKPRRIQSIFIGLGVVCVAISVSLLVFVNAVAKSAVERGGSYALGVDTTVKEIDIALLSGETKIDLLTVTNPEGFASPHFLQIEHGRIALSLPTLIKKSIVVPEFALSGIHLNLDFQGNQFNYQTILDNLRKFESQDKNQATPKQDGKKLVIERLSIRNIQVDINLQPIGGRPRHIPIKIEQIEWKNTDTHSDQAHLIAQLTSVVIKSILAAVVQESGGLIPQTVISSLDESLQQVQKIGDITIKITDELQKSHDLLGQVTDQSTKTISGQLGEQVEDISQEIGKNLNDLFQRNKNKPNQPQQ